MNRAAAVLASSIALAVAACGPPPPPPYSDVTFYWRFQDMDGNPPYGDFTASVPGCGIANADEVRATLVGPGGTFTQTVPCVASNGMPGATFTALPAGPYTFTLEGRRQNFTVYVVEGSGDFSNFPAFYQTLLAVYPNMDLWYDLPPGVTCAGVAEIAFELDNGPISPGIVEYSSANVFVACRNPPGNGFTMPSIPVGNYGYRYVAALDAPWPNGRSLYQQCGFGFPPDAPLVQVQPGGSAYTATLGLPFGQCP